MLILEIGICSTLYPTLLVPTPGGGGGTGAKIF